MNKFVECYILMIVMKNWEKFLVSPILLIVGVVNCCVAEYTPDWTSLDKRPIPEWFDEAKIGIFVHWGVFSVPGFSSEVFWETWKSGKCVSCNEFMAHNYKPGFTYQEFGPKFKAEFFNPTDWAELFERAGAKYVVLTSKHCDGYALWPSKYSANWNAMDTGPKRDLVGDLAEAIRNTTSLRFGLYYCMIEWFHPSWIDDKANGLKTDGFVEAKVAPSLREIVEKYAPDIVWPDGEWEASSTYWKSREFLTWLFNESRVKDKVVINDRWGNDTRGKHGGFWTGGDRLNPGYLLPHKWENCMTLDKHSWGYRRNADIGDYLTPRELLTTLVETVACGGNLLVNVGPTKDGMIDPIQQERLLQMGEWLGVNGDAVYGTVPWTKSQNDTVTKGVWYTSSKNGTVTYAFVTIWPGRFLHIGSVNYDQIRTIGMLGYQGNLIFEKNLPRILVHFPRQELIRSKWIRTLVISSKSEDRPCV